MTPELYQPVLDCFMRVLPYTYRAVAAPVGTRILVRVVGVGGGDWHLYRAEDRWMLAAEPAGKRVATVTIPHQIAWRIFTKGISREESASMVSLEGDRVLGSHVLDSVAIVG